MGQGSNSMGGGSGKGSTSPVTSSPMQSGFTASAGPAGMMAHLTGHGGDTMTPPTGIRYGGGTELVPTGPATPSPVPGGGVGVPVGYASPIGLRYGDGMEPMAAGPAAPSPVPGGGVGVSMVPPGGGVSSGVLPVTANNVMRPQQRSVMGNAANSVPGMALRRMFGR